MEKYTMFMDQKNQYSENEYTTQSNLQIQCNPYQATLVAQTVKCLSTMWETWVPSLGREDPLEEEMAIHSSIITGKIPRTEKSGGLQSMGSLRVRHN